MLFTVLAASAVVLSACEYPGVPHPQAGRTMQIPLTVPQETPTAQREEPSQDSTIIEGPVVLLLKDFKLEPDQITVKAGKITFVLKNEGRYTHDFRIEGLGINEKSPKIAAGRERQWEITLEPGEYRISCPISNHDERGMVGTLMVK